MNAGGDGGTDWHRLDPRKIDLDRVVGAIVTAVLPTLWLPFTVAAAVLSYW